MENHQLFPFERNRYYTGKLLTSTDFQTEQTYMNNKRRFINYLMFGSGVVCGLSVFNLDDLSIMVESGVALDRLGREIVVETSVVKKLSAIDGFEQLHSVNASLCLRYKEKQVHPVYSIDKQGKDEEYECNRVTEGYQLFLADTEMLEQEYQMDSEFFSKSVLYEDENYIVDIKMPAVVSCGKKVKFLLRIQKNTNEKKSISADITLQAPAFFSNQGEHEITVHTGLISLEKDEVFEQEYWLTAQEQEMPETSMIAKIHDIHIQIDEVEVSRNESFVLKTSISASTPRELITREIGKISLEMRALSGAVDYIRLADFTLVRTDSAYIIDEINEIKAKKYISVPAEEDLRSEYNSFFDRPYLEKSVAKKEEIEETVKNIRPYQEPIYATGICEIPLGAETQVGDIRYSSEIMHGLGKGDVYVQVGVEYFTQDRTLGLGTQAKQTIYGNAELFAADHVPISFVETAVKVNVDKGSFSVAAKLIKETTYTILTLRWIAIQLPLNNQEKVEVSTEGKSITAETPTVVLEPRESYFFNVRFENLEPCGLTYVLTEPASGEITRDGIYTAPAKEGVYEIQIFCTGIPLIHTYAYAVVKKKDIGQKQEQKQAQRQVQGQEQGQEQSKNPEQQSES